MATVAVEQLLYLLDIAFEHDRWHSLIGNVGSVQQEHWLWVPADGKRSIRDIVAHVGGCKFMYENHAFGDASFGWDDPLVSGVDRLGDGISAAEWLREGQAQLRKSIAALDDAELLQPRRTNWGELKEARWIIAIMIQHDLYHAGEINHIRALACGDDE